MESYFNEKREWFLSLDENEEIPIRFKKEDIEKKLSLVEDAFRELKEKEEIWKLPQNSLTKIALENVKESELSKRLEEHWLP